jgi:hypothetical protein
LQLDQAAHAGAFCAVLKKPVMHAEHAWFVVLVPTVLTYWPAMHGVYVLQLGAFALVLYEPAAHVPHARLTVALPAVVIDVPAGQSAHATHVVVALAS